ncbi:MAG TPA: protein phosphatase 2C domain-containing protein [Roseiflexaceae bacterium]|nr:protein phosphatase 2C domain-containing protein [Roseiflexaceae bacterium]
MSSSDSRSPDDHTTQPLEPPASALHHVGVIAAARRDIGRVREINQDQVFTLTASMPRAEQHVTMGLYLVADGMGGHEGGEVASSMAVAEIVRHVLAELLLPALSGEMNASMQAIVAAAIEHANHMIWSHARALGSDMGTTCTVALLLGHSLSIGHVGDTRAYLIGNDGIRLLTRDHSAVGRLIELGQLDEAEAREHPLRSQLYRTLGQTAHVAVDVVYERITEATHLLLVSDGLWGLVDDAVMCEIVQQHEPAVACAELIARANAAGGEDNISAVVVVLPPPLAEEHDE